MQIDRYLKTEVGGMAAKQQEGGNARRSYAKNNFTT